MRGGDSHPVRSEIRSDETTAARGGRPRSERLHKAILKAAVDLVLSSGFRSLSMDGIAARAGVGRMTIYRRWPNKAAIIMEAFVMRVDPGTLSNLPKAIRRASVSRCGQWRE